MNDYANEGFIDKRIVEICRQAERNYIISQSPNEFGNKIIIPKIKIAIIYFNSVPLSQLIIL